MAKMRVNTEMELMRDDKSDFYNSKPCHICGCEFKKGESMVRDQDHRTGRYRGAAHSKCNINYFANRYLPGVMHSLKGYDGHLIIKNAYKIMQNLDSNTNISAIPNSYEKFMSINIGNVKFIDSMQFMKSSLEKLTGNLYDKEDTHKNFKHMKRYDADNLELLCQKGYDPCEWVDNISKLSYEGVPPIEAFNSRLKQSKLTEGEYAHVIRVNHEMNCKILKDYHEIYLQRDVLVLADIFENFRESCRKNYGVDPVTMLVLLV